jgi:hypothetical protein
MEFFIDGTFGDLATIVQGANAEADLVTPPCVFFGESGSLQTTRRWRASPFEHRSYPSGTLLMAVALPL